MVEGMDEGVEKEVGARLELWDAVWGRGRWDALGEWKRGGCVGDLLVGGGGKEIKKEGQTFGLTSALSDGLHSLRKCQAGIQPRVYGVS